LIEVELLGREHYERMQRERAQAEATGEAQLRRLQEQSLQTRIKYNRAKHQYYFPHLKGWKYALLHCRTPVICTHAPCRSSCTFLLTL